VRSGVALLTGARASRRLISHCRGLILRFYSDDLCETLPKSKKQQKFTLNFSEMPDQELRLTDHPADRRGFPRTIRRER
jgi:hypothetical protein